MAYDTPLLAERAWSYAMQLKQENANAEEEDLRKRQHLIKRLKKAAKWARELVRLCSSSADARTCLEAEAYASNMEATMLLERDEWQDALVGFTRAKQIYAKLAQAGSIAADIDLFSARVGEIEPSVRYCSYNLSRDEGVDADEILAGLRAGGTGGDMLQSKLDKMLDDALKKQVAAGDLIVLHFGGAELTLRNEGARLGLLRARDVLSELRQLKPPAATVDTKARARCETLFLEMFESYDNARRAIGKELDGMGIATGSAQEKQFETLRCVDAFLKILKLQRVIERNVMLIQFMSSDVDAARMYTKLLDTVSEIEKRARARAV